MFKTLDEVLASVSKAGDAVEPIEGELWTSSQRQGSSLHEVPYRACFKPELPRFFISSLTSPGDVVYDPFAGRGTTAIEAALLGRNVIANDVNPIATLYTSARLGSVDLDLVDARLDSIPRMPGTQSEEENLGMFYQSETLNELRALKEYFSLRRKKGDFDSLDLWLQMVATTRLTGHSPGFFSVYTLPPNQAVSRERQLLINAKRNQSPTYRDTRALIARKSTQLRRSLSAGDIGNLERAGKTALFLNEDAAATAAIQSGSVALTVTSPPFLDVVNYSADNWLRAWFLDLDSQAVQSRITMSKSVEEWSLKMSQVFLELHRVTKQGGHVAFEVGEVRNGRVMLEDAVIPVGLAAGFKLKAVLINTQEFSKTSNIWGVNNNTAGTNSNRIVLFEKTGGFLK
jgi:DNA modification methylase